MKVETPDSARTIDHADDRSSDYGDLAPSTSLITRSTANALVIKDEDVFFLTDTDGTVPLEKGHGFGLYYHDCRYLNGYELRLAGRKPESLVWSAEQGFMATLGLSNPDMMLEDGRLLHRHSAEIRWSRVLDSNRLALFDSITFNNLKFERIDFKVSLTFQSQFEDIFAIRGLLPQKHGRLHEPSWNKSALRFFYEGTDKLYRSLSVRFSLSPLQVSGTRAYFHLELGPKESKTILLSLAISESEDMAVSSTKPRRLNPAAMQSAMERAHEASDKDRARITTDSLMLNRILDRSMRDLRILKSHNRKVEYFAAGIPWFAALFGRDSIITALQTLAYSPGVAEQTIRLLASYQGQKRDAWRDEEPGKILHELRLGEMARNGEIPHTPYYGSVDSTPLFLVLVGQHARWTGDLTIFNQLRSNIEMALDWISQYGDSDRDGYVEYIGRSEKGLANQGWKDSGDAIVNRDGSLATPPIALVEVQGYVYQAKMLMAELYKRAGESKRADALLAEADKLKRRFNKDYWLKEGFYALALQDGGRTAAVLSSNAGHALWSGIAEQEKAARVAERLMGEDMFSGWGIRTLSERELYYNPLGYHLGTVWPHDNSLVAAGMRRYGFDDMALRVFSGLFEAAMHFHEHRLPELFGGFRREDYSVPAVYPVTCQPQAWAAGSIPYLMKALLGLEPEAFEGRLRVARPILPDFVRQVDIVGLRVGQSRIDLRFERSAASVAVKVLSREGHLDVDVET